MAKPIKWRPVDVRLLTNTVKSFNEKLLSIKNSENSRFLPLELNASDLQSKIKTRSDFNRIINEIRLSKIKNAFELVNVKESKITRYELELLNRRNQAVNIKRKREAERLKLETRRDTANPMDIAKNYLLTERKITPERKTLIEMRILNKALNKELFDNEYEQRALNYKQNYLKAIINNLGFEGEILYNYIEKIEAQLLYDIGAVNEILEIRFVYDPLEAHIVTLAILDEWERLIGGT